MSSSRLFQKDDNFDDEDDDDMYTPQLGRERTQQRETIRYSPQKSPLVTKGHSSYCRFFMKHLKCPDGIYCRFIHAHPQNLPNIDEDPKFRESEPPSNTPELMRNRSVINIEMKYDVDNK